MTTVSLEGRLGEIVGRSFSFKTRTLKEVLAAIEANTGKLRNYFHQNSKRMFAIFVDGKEIQTDPSLNINVENKEILIIPILMGAFVKTLTGFIVKSVLKLTAGTFAAKAATFVIGTVLGAALAFGISMLIAKLMKPDDPDLANTSSFVFGQAENVTRQGVVVPVGYGRMQVGSRVISVNLFNVDRSEYDRAHSGTAKVNGAMPYFGWEVQSRFLLDQGSAGAAAVSAMTEGEGGIFEVDNTNPGE